MESEEECHELGIEISKERIESLRTDRKKKKLKERLLKETAKADNRGVCYLSRIPPHMDHVRLRQILSQFGDIGRIYLAPESERFSMSIGHINLCFCIYRLADAFIGFSVQILKHKCIARRLVAFVANSFLKGMWIFFLCLFSKLSTGL